MTENGCQQCGENTYSGAGASSCTSCPDGMISAAGSTSEADCYGGEKRIQPEFSLIFELFVVVMIFILMLIEHQFSNNREYCINMCKNYGQQQILTRLPANNSTHTFR